MHWTKLFPKNFTVLVSPFRGLVYITLYHYRNGPIWADTVDGDLALSQEGLAKTVQFFGNNLVQCMKKHSEWSELFVPFLVINASSDMV